MVTKLAKQFYNINTVITNNKLYNQFVPISSEYFYYDKATKTFATEMSQCNGKLQIKNLYKDEVDQGFVMVSELTGKSALFVLCGVDSNLEAVISWRFNPSIEAINDNPTLTGVKVIVFNDE